MVMKLVKLAAFVVGMAVLAITTSVGAITIMDELRADPPPHGYHWGYCLVKDGSHG